MRTPHLNPLFSTPSPHPFASLTRHFPSLPPPLNPLLGQEGWGQEQNEIFIIGGGEIYAQGLPYTDKLYLTIVESDAQGDVFFPDWRKDFTKETFREERIDPKTGLKYTWIDLERNHGTNTE